MHDNAALFNGISTVQCAILQPKWMKKKQKKTEKNKNNENYEDEEAYNIEYARSVHTNWYRKCIRFNRKMHITRR